MDFGSWPREEQYINYLAFRTKDDPIPPGVFTDNPFKSNPSDREDSWYLFEGSTNEGHQEGDVRRTENGFWKWSIMIRIPAKSTIGFKNVFEFYQGNPPLGTRTSWMMHQYHAGPKFEGASHLQENILLCRLFLHNDKGVNSSQPNNSFTACAGFLTLGSDLITQKKESEADGNVPVDVSQDDFIEMKDLMSSDGEISDRYDNSLYGDYLELNDILTSDTASTSSANSSRMSFNSEEYFNVDELLREIRDGPLPIENEEKVDCVSSVTEPVQLHQVDRDRLLKGVPSSDKEASKTSHDFSNGDYLELRDLLPSNMASLDSGDLDCRGGSNFVEYFNADELLRDIGGVGRASGEEQHDEPDCSVCVKNSILPSPVSLTGSESVASRTDKFEVADENEQPNDQLGLVPEGVPTSASSRTGQVKRNLSDRSEDVSSSNSSSDDSESSIRSGNDGSSSKSGSKTPQSKRRKSIKRLAKIGKKFLCFF